ncbi:hypothetical protein PAMP_016161 [Pampus punctatissimus]
MAGKRVVLKCRSSHGTPPLNYRWSKTSGDQMLHRDAFVDTIGGTLYLPEITERDCGTYLCTVKSLVGMEDCEVTLNITSPQTMSYRLEAVTTAVPIVVVVIIAAVTMICLCRRKQLDEEVFSNKILEDELPPHKWHRRAQGNAQVRKTDGQGKVPDKVLRDSAANQSYLRQLQLLVEKLL